VDDEGKGDEGRRNKGNLGHLEQERPIDAEIIGWVCLGAGFWYG
jgi:hypothetical protein